jgi:hypothetical protein
MLTSAIFLWIQLVNQTPLIETRFQFRLLEAAVTAYAEGDLDAVSETLAALERDREMFHRATLGITEEPRVDAQ